MYRTTIWLIALAAAGCGGDDCFLPAGTYQAAYRLQSHDCTSTPKAPSDGQFTVAAGDKACGFFSDSKIVDLPDKCLGTLSVSGQVTSVGYKDVRASVQVDCPEAAGCKAVYEVFFSVVRE